MAFFVWLPSFWLNIDSFKGKVIFENPTCGPYITKHLGNAFAVLFKTQVV